MSPAPDVPSFSGVLKTVNGGFIFKTSKLILKNYPNSDVTQLFGRDLQSRAGFLEMSSSDLEISVNELNDMWRYLIFYQPKEEEFRGILEQAGIGDDGLEPFTDLWLTDGREAIDRVSKISTSGLPRILDVHCTTQLKLASGSAESCRSPEIIVNLKTSAGPKKLIFSREQATQLYYETNKIQAAVDKLLE